MRGEPHDADLSKPVERESYARLLANLVGVLLAVGGIGYGLWSNPPKKPAPMPVPPAPASTTVARAAVGASKSETRPAPLPEPDPEPEPPPPPPRELDRVAVAKALADLDAASRDRERAEARLSGAEQQLKEAALQAANDAAANRKLALRVRDPSAQMARASMRGGFLKAERDRLKDEIAAINKAPRPKAKLLIDRNPVAKPADGDEFHFELRRNRITFIDLDQLMTLIKSDAQLRIRLSDNARAVESRVGPVGSFSMEYTLARAAPGIQELMERHGLSYDLRGWELIPEFEGRGETYEATRSPVSAYSRAINRLTPNRSTITMWIYPDSFALYRRLRDELHARGFLVAARPLPEGMTIRGSPSGSLSAGQ
jgi:hypothetical protein